MFGFFKKKPPSLMDGFILSVYGINPPKRSANFAQAVSLAHGTLLYGKVDFSEVEAIAHGLFQGPMPYSTHDLAVSVALNCFKQPTLISKLIDVQILARIQTAQWAEENKLVRPLAIAFENVLYELYKPQEQSRYIDNSRKKYVSTSEFRNSPVQKHLDKKHEEKLAELHKTICLTDNYDVVIWKTLKIMFNVDTEKLPSEFVNNAIEESYQLQQIGVTPALAGFLIGVKEFDKDIGPEWEFIQNVAAEGGMNLFYEISRPCASISHSEMETFREICKVLMEKNVKPKNAARMIIEGLSEKRNY